MFSIFATVLCRGVRGTNKTINTLNELNIITSRLFIMSAVTVSPSMWS